MRKDFVAFTVLLFVVSFSVDSAILEENNCEITNPAAYEVVYTISISNNGPATITQIDLWIPVLQEHQPYQRVESWVSNPQPLKITEDKSGNKLAHIRLKEKITPGKSVTIQVKCKVQIYTISCKPVTSTFEKYDKESALYKKYTAPETHIESDNQKIKEKAAEIAGDIDDCYLAAKKIYEFVISYMSYVRLDRCRGALYALEEKKGDCSEYSDLFIALCRARGIPARTVHGFTYSSSGDQLHDWAEIYIPGTGWIPVDATWGRHGKDYFGTITNKHIIVYTGRMLTAEESEFSWFYYLYHFGGKKPDVTRSFGPNITKTELWYEDPTMLKEAESLYAEGENCMEKGDYETARAKFQKARELYNKLGDSSQVKLCDAIILLSDAGKKADSLFSEALSYFEKKMYSEAKSKFDQAKNLYSMAGNKQKLQECDTYIVKCDTGIEADSLFEKGKAQTEEGTLDEAKLNFEKAQKKYEELGDAEKVQQCQQMIQEIEKKKQEGKAEKEQGEAKKPEKKGSCLGTLFVVFVVIGGSAVHCRNLPCVSPEKC